MAPRSPIVLLFAALLPFAAARPRAQELDLDLSTRFRYDDDAQGADWDNLTHTRLSVTDLLKDRLDFKISGWGLWDIDGSDAFDEALDDRPLRLSELFFDLRNLGPLTRLRLGRQRFYDVDYLHYDGATAWFREGKALSFFAFAGRPVSYYSTASGDFLGGGGIVWKPSWRSRHQWDSYLLHEGGETRALSGWRWTRSLPAGWRGTSRLRFTGIEPRHWRLDLTKYFEKLGLGLDVNYYLQPRERGVGDEVSSRNLALFSRLLGSRTPNQRLGINLTKTLGEDWMIQAGGWVRRRIDHRGSESYNSLESETGRLSVTRFHVFIPNLSATAGAEFTENEHDHMSSFTGSLDYAPSSKWRFGLGASLSRYRFDPVDFATNLNDQEDADLLLEELRNLQYYAEARWRPNRNHEFRAEISLEDSDESGGDGVSARIGYRYRLRRSLAPAAAPAEEGKEEEARP